MAPSKAGCSVCSRRPVFRSVWMGTVCGSNLNIQLGVAVRPAITADPWRQASKFWSPAGTPTLSCVFGIE